MDAERSTAAGEGLIWGRNMKRGFSGRIVFAVLGSLAAVIVVGIFFYLVRQNHSGSIVYRYDDGWEITIGGDEYHDVSLSEFSFKAVARGTEIVMRNTIPKEVADGSTMRLLMYLSTVEARLDGEVIYQYGQEDYRQGRLVGSGYHFITLPNDCDGAEIEIIITAAEPAAITNIPVIEVVPSDNVYTNFADTRMIGMFISFFLFMLGAVLTVVSIFAICFNRAYFRLLLISTFSFLMGIWSMCNNKLLQIFSTDLATNTFVEYLALYLAPIPFVVLIWHMRKDELTRWRRMLCLFVCGLVSSFALIALVLQLLNIVHFSVTLTYFHAIGVVSLICMFIVGTQKLKKTDASNRILISGIIVMSTAIALDLVRFNVQKYLIPEKELLSNSLIPIGTLVFIILLLVSYLIYLYEMVMSKAEKETLTKMAYHDALSGLFNRAKCDEEFKRLDSASGDYAIISFDLNGLKSTNDQLGHAMGDLLLQAFGEILKEAFGDFGKVFRMGGDEFLVIVEGSGLARIDRGVEKMLELEQLRSVAYPFTIDTSYGIARRSECSEKRCEKVLQTADKRMYEMKVQAHKQRQ